MAFNKTINKTVIFVFFLVFLSFLIFSTSAQASSLTTIHLFWAEGCPHCAHEKEFLSKYVKNNPDVRIENYEITKNKNNLSLLQEVGKALKTEVAGVPFTVIGDKYIVGFQDAATTGVKIDKLVQDHNDYDLVSKIKGDMALGHTIGTSSRDCQGISCIFENGKSKNTDKNGGIPEKINLPLLGNIETKYMSLPLMTFVIALLDGFNPCAMWTLLFLISLLLGMQDRKRMWVLGITFITASGLVYFLFLSAWLNLFIFLGFIVWVRLIVAFVAISAGIYYLWDFWKNRDGACKLANNKERKYVFEKLKILTQSQNFAIAIVGIALLAIAVNMVELICSAGLPAVYTNILSLSNLPKWQYYGYLIFYVVVFMIDDLFVFFTAMITLKSVHADSKFARYSHLIGGILMAIIGILLIFKPGWLMFG